MRVRVRSVHDACAVDYPCAWWCGACNPVFADDHVLSAAGRVAMATGQRHVDTIDTLVGAASRLARSGRSR